MRVAILTLCTLMLVLGAAGAVEAQGPGGDCDVEWDDSWAAVGGTGTPVDGTSVGAPYLDCTY